MKRLNPQYMERLIPYLHYAKAMAREYDDVCTFQWGNKTICVGKHSIVKLIHFQLHNSVNTIVGYKNNTKLSDYHFGLIKVKIEIFFDNLIHRPIFMAKFKMRMLWAKL